MIDLLSVSYLAAGADPQVVVVPDPDTVSPGFLGFAVMFLLAIATIVLIRSMVAHLRKVTFRPEPEGEAGPKPELIPDAGPAARER